MNPQEASFLADIMEVAVAHETLDPIIMVGVLEVVQYTILNHLSIEYDGPVYRGKHKDSGGGAGSGGAQNAHAGG